MLTVYSYSTACSSQKHTLELSLTCKMAFACHPLSLKYNLDQRILLLPVANIQWLCGRSGTCAQAVEASCGPDIGEARVQPHACDFGQKKIITL